MTKESKTEILKGLIAAAMDEVTKGAADTIFAARLSNIIQADNTARQSTVAAFQKALEEVAAGKL